MTDHEGQESMAGTRRPIIEVKNLRKEYPVLDETVVALERINLTIPQGQIRCIYGESGSGKSTLLNQLAGMEKPTKGGVRIGGVPISRLNERQLAEFRQKHLGFVFQSYNLLPNLTAVENVAMPLMFQGMPKNKREAIAKKMLKRVGLGKRMNHYPTQMSGGQQQRVGIARAFAARPQVVFADEPTGNLDSVSSAEVLGFLKRSVNELGQTIVMVTHDAVAASYADRAIVFSDGRIVADEQHPNAEVMNELLMAERERTTRTTLTDTPADQMAQMAGVRNVPDLPITDAPLPPAVPTSGREGTLRHARAAARHAR